MINEKPDFIIHCGDLFHNFKPSPGSLRLAIKILAKIKEASIPFYVIRGNHDASKAQAQRFGGTILKFLEELGYLNYIEDETLKVNDSINITGIGEYGKTTAHRIEEVLRNYPLKQSKFNILMLHGYLQGQVSDSIYDVSGYQLASIGFDYIALGHYHKKWEEPENSIYCPGSTEQTSINDWGKPDKDGFFRKVGYYCVDLSSDEETEKNWKMKVRRKEFAVRPKGRFTFNFDDKTLIEDLKSQANEFVLKHDLEGAIIRYDFIGELPLGKQSLINFSKLPAIQKSKALHIKTNQQISKIQLKQAGPNLTTNKALVELLDKSYGFAKTSTGKWLDLVNESIKILGNKAISSEKAEEIEAIYGLVTDASKKFNETDMKRRSIKKGRTEPKSKEKPKEKLTPETNRKTTEKLEQSDLSKFFNEGEK